MVPHAPWKADHQRDQQKTNKPIRVHLDYSLPAVRERMMSVIDRLMKEGPIDWFKFDYNIDIGNDFDSRGDLAENTRLYNHLEGYYQWLDDIAQISARDPRKLFERRASLGFGNCAGTPTRRGFPIRSIRDTPCKQPTARRSNSCRKSVIIGWPAISGQIARRLRHDDYHERPRLVGLHVPNRHERPNWFLEPP